MGCARVLAGEGVRVWLVARDAKRLAQACEAIRAFGRQADPIVADLAREDLADRIAAIMPAPNVLITNPGATPAGSLTEAAVWRAQAEAIVGCTLVLLDLVLPSIRDRGFGRIINITAAGAFEGSPAFGVAGALRATLTHASAMVACKIGPHGVTINSVAPGPVRSEGLDKHFECRAREFSRVRAVT